MLNKGTASLEVKNSERNRELENFASLEPRVCEVLLYLIDMKNAGIGLQKVQLLECKMYMYRPLKMDAESAQNLDFKTQKLQVSHCNDCRF